MKNRKVILGIVFVILSLIIFYEFHFKSEWNRFPLYKDPKIEVHVSTCEHDSLMCVIVQILYDDEGDNYSASLYNKFEFDQGISDILKPVNDNIELPPLPEGSTYYTSSSTYTNCYQNDPSQKEKLMKYIKNFDYQFTFTDRKNSNLKYKLNSVPISFHTLSDNQ